MEIRPEVMERLLAEDDERLWETIRRIAVMNNISLASMIHFKDFHIKRTAPPVEEGYIKTFHGNYLRGALTGDGDVDLKRISKIINESGYEGYLSVEFEGWEDPLFACPRAIKNVKALLRG